MAKMTKEDIMKLAKPFDKMTAADFTVLRSLKDKKDKKVKGEAIKPMKFNDKVSKSIMSTSNRITKPRKHHG